MLRDETSDLYESHQSTPFFERLRQPEDRSSAQLRRFAREDWIAVRDQGQAGANLYLAPDVAAAIGLSAVQATGIADREIMRTAARALYKWQPGQAAEDHYPVTAALYGTIENQVWVLEIRVFDEAGERAIRACCYDIADPPKIDRGSISTLHVNLSWLLVPLAVQVCRAMGGRADA
jgi:hypothetical protein